MVMVMLLTVCRLCCLARIRCAMWTWTADPLGPVPLCTHLCSSPGTITPEDGPPAPLSRSSVPPALTEPNPCKPVS